MAVPARLRQGRTGILADVLHQPASYTSDIAEILISPTW